MERQKRKRHGCPFLRHSSCYTARFIGRGFSMLDEHTNKAMMETVKPLSFYLSFFSLFCVIDSTRFLSAVKQQQRNLVRSYSICMWQFLSALSDRFTHISLHFPRHKKKMSVAGSAITTPSPRPQKSFQI